MRPKVLYSILSSGFGGLERYPLLVQKELDHAGWDMAVCTLENSELHQACLKKNIPVFTVPYFRRFSLSLILRLKKILKQTSPSLVHSRKSGEIYSWKAALCGHKKISLVQSFHLGVTNKKNFFHKNVYKRCRACIAPTKKLAQELIQNIPVPEQNISVLPNGVDLSRFDALKITNDLRPSLGVDKETFVVLCVGNVSPEKGVGNFLDAALKLQNKNVLFIWAGDPWLTGRTSEKEKLWEKYQNRIKEENLPFLFTGPRKDIPDLMKAADLFVLPSWNELFGNVYIEAMAMGLPVIGCRAGGVPEIIEHGHTGSLCPPKDPGKLADLIRQYMDDPEMRKKQGSQAVLTSRKFSLNKHVKNLISIYEKSLSF